jgi:predicted  nucleic acid-binding Zn-ribbon protein
MGSLFDPVEDIQLPDQRPARDWKKAFKLGGLALAVVAVIGGGYYTYETLKPRKLTEKPVPQSPDMLLTELKEAREEIDSNTRDIYARIQQFNARMEMLGRKQISFSQVFLQGLSAEEEQALDKLVKEEKDPSYRGVLGQVVEDMKTIRDLQTKVTDLEAKLPGDGIEVRPGDTHLKMAQKYLMETHSIPEARAKELATRLNIMDTGLEKGMKAHFYYDPAKDFFGTWVSQSDAKRSPLAIVRAREMHLIGERNEAVAKATDLETKKVELEEVLAKLESEIKALEGRKAALESNVATLEGERNAAREEVTRTSTELATQKNSMWYEADLAVRLKARGILTTFNKVEKIADVKFASSIDLAKSKSITLKPSQFGIDRIRDVRIVPSFFREKRELDVKFAEDGTVEVTVLDEAAMKGQRVLFVVEQ